MSEPRATIGYGYLMPDTISYDDVDHVCIMNDSLKCEVIYSGCYDNKSDFVLVAKETVQNFSWDCAERLNGLINQPNPLPNVLSRLRQICDKLEIPFDKFACDWYCCTYRND